MKLNNNLLYASLLLLFAACTSSPEKGSRVDRLPYYSDAKFTPHWIEENAPALDTFHRIPSFNLINQHGERVTEQTFEGKVYVADFFFTTCPGICPKMTENMGIIQSEFLDEDDLLILSHSVTPERDSVPMLQSYAERKDVVSGKWHLVTGPQEEIYLLGRRHYFVEEDLGIEKNLTEFLHTENFVLIDQNRHIRGIYNGLNKASINQLILDIKTLIAE